MSAAPDTLLIRDWIEARKLWDYLQVIRHLRAAIIMPTHLHAALEEKEVALLLDAAKRYVLWRNFYRNERGPVFTHGTTAVYFSDQRHERRTCRYILLNTCREGITVDPLAWPFSTHRDAVGLAWPVVRQPERDAERFHRWVSSDPSADRDGTPLPVIPTPEQLARVTVSEVRAAVSSLTRTTSSRLSQRGPARTLLIRACRHLTPLSAKIIARDLGVHPATVRRAAIGRVDRGIEMVSRVLGDPRFPLLTDADLPWLPLPR